MSSKEALSIALSVAIVFVSIAAARHVHGNQVGEQELELASAQIDVLPMMSHVENLTDLTFAEAY